MKRTKLLPSLAAIVWTALGIGAGAQAWTAADARGEGEPWPTSTPERQGFDSVELAKVFDFIKENNVDFNGLIIVRNGYKALEAYFYPFQRDLPHDVASVTKSVTSLLVGMAIDRGLIKGVQEPALNFFPERAAAVADEQKKRLTLEHLLTMTSGFCHSYRDGEAQPGAMRLSPDGVRFMLDQPLVTAPGSVFAYCSLAPHLLSAVVTRATGLNELEFARKNLFGPLGITRVEWPADSQGNSSGWGDLFIRPIDLAKIGYLLLGRGLWQGTRIVFEEWIQVSTRPHVFESDTTGYGYLWWMPLSTPGLYEARGRGGQRLSLWPRRNLLVVMIGNGGHDPGDVGAIIGRALKSDGALPENPAAVAALKLSVRDAFSRQVDLKVIVIPVGLDGVYRFSNNSRYGLPLAARGAWRSNDEFEFVLNEPANDRAFDVRLRFEGEDAELTGSERTGLVESVAIRARIKQ